VLPVHEMRGSQIFAVLRLHVRIVLVSLLCIFGIVCPRNELVDGKLRSSGVSLWYVREDGGKALYVLRHKPSTPIEVIESLPVVEVVEVEHRRTDGARKEVVH
jgi:hypothetical protein